MQRTIVSNGVSTDVAALNPSYAWGFFLEGSYHFNTGNDINLNWYHLTNSYIKNFSSAVFLPIAARPTDLSTGIPRAIIVNPKWDAVNLEVGQHVDFDVDKSIRFHGGFQYARLINNTTISFATVVQNLSNTGISLHNPTYNGFGPRVGADMTYACSHGFSIYANGAAALLAGSNKYSDNITASRGTRSSLLSTRGSTAIVVPELEAKLGVNYIYTVAQGDLIFDFAWLWINYFNAIQSDPYGLTPVNADFGLQGPVFGLKWLGNIA